MWVGGPFFDVRAKYYPDRPLFGDLQCIGRFATARFIGSVAMPETGETPHVQFKEWPKLDHLESAHLAKCRISIHILKTMGGIIFCVIRGRRFWSVSGGAHTWYLQGPLCDAVLTRAASSDSAWGWDTALSYTELHPRRIGVRA